MVGKIIGPKKKKKLQERDASSVSNMIVYLNYNSQHVATANALIISEIHTSIYVILMYEKYERVLYWLLL